MVLLLSEASPFEVASPAGRVIQSVQLPDSTKVFIFAGNSTKSAALALALPQVREAHIFGECKQIAKQRNEVVHYIVV